MQNPFLSPDDESPEFAELLATLGEKAEAQEEEPQPPLPPQPLTRDPLEEEEEDPEWWEMREEDQRAERGKPTSPLFLPPLPPPPKPKDRLTAQPFWQKCPSCRQTIRFTDPDLVGRKIDCPTCHYRQVVEKPNEQPPVLAKPREKGRARASAQPKQVRPRLDNQRVWQIIAGAALILATIFGGTMLYKSVVPAAPTTPTTQKPEEYKGRVILPPELQEPTQPEQ